MTLSQPLSVQKKFIASFDSANPGSDHIVAEINTFIKTKIFSCMVELIKVYYVAVMIIRAISILILISVPFLAISQEIPDSVSLKKFVAVYIEEKKLNEELAMEFEDKIQQLAFDESTYQTYRQHKKEGTELSPELQEIEADISRLRTEFKSKKELLVKKLCTDRSLEYTRFLEMTKRYQHEIQFNRACIPYFMSYFNKSKNE